MAPAAVAGDDLAVQRSPDGKWEWNGEQWQPVWRPSSWEILLAVVVLTLLGVLGLTILVVSPAWDHAAR